MHPAALCSLLAMLLLWGPVPAGAHGDATHAASRAASAAAAEETPFGREGDPKRVARTIRVDMSDAMRFTPAQLTVRRGQTVRFVVHNRGQALHEMVIGTPELLQEHAALMQKFPDMEHAEPYMVHVKPGASGEIVWQFTRPGRFQFACLIPGHFDAGMVGTVRVR